MPEQPILDGISGLLARHKLVPFLGAGISRPQLGFAAPGLRNRLAEVMVNPPPDGAELAQVADLMEQISGRDYLVAELRKHLCREEFDDALSTSHLLTFSLGCGLVYTTNQDNLFELAAQKYGRPHRTVVTLSDLADAEPGERLYLKFHGDPTVPESLVFTQSSYLRRLSQPDNFLDIRLRSDLIGRGLLFVGYSLQDENLCELLRQTKRAYHGGTPTSYLIAFDYQPELETMTAEFGVKVVDPRSLFPDTTDNASAFERCLQAISNRTMQLKTRKALDSMFSESIAVPILIEHELVALERTAAEEGVASGLAALRAQIDLTQIPAHLQRRVAEVVVVIAEKISGDEELAALKAALFNMHIASEHALLAMAAYMAANNIRKPSTGYDSSFLVASSAMTEEMWPTAAAIAVQMLLGGGYTISDGFRQSAMHWFEDLSSLSDSGRPFVMEQIAAAWRGSTNESPLSRATRLGPLAGIFRRKNFRQLTADMEGNFPQQFPLPKHTL
jgi:hypothetical protein